MQITRQSSFKRAVTLTVYTFTSADELQYFLIWSDENADYIDYLFQPLSELLLVVIGAINIQQEE